MVALKLPAPLVSLGLTSLKPDSFAFADMVVLPSSALVLTIVRPRTAVTASARTAQIGLIRHLPLTRRGVTSKARPPAPTPGVCPHYRGGLHLWGDNLGVPANINRWRWRWADDWRQQPGSSSLPSTAKTARRSSEPARTMSK